MQRESSNLFGQRRAAKGDIGEWMLRGFWKTKSKTIMKKGGHIFSTNPKRNRTRYCFSDSENPGAASQRKAADFAQHQSRIKTNGTKRIKESCNCRFSA
jgi:hypothetical protein